MLLRKNALWAMPPVAMMPHLTVKGVEEAMVKMYDDLYGWIINAVVVS